MNNPTEIHPWIKEFEESPETALDELLRGVADISPYERAEASDVLDMFFGGLDPEHPLRRTLDATICAWLEKRRKDGPDFRMEYGLNRYQAELVQALASVYRLSLSGTARFLRGHFSAYQRWLGPLYLNPARDACGELWRTMALMQEDRRLLENWQLLCEGAGRTWPSHYLSIGLLGLRKLPPGENGNGPSGLNPELLTGLLTWGLNLHDNRHDRREFLLNFRAIKAMYPRAPQSWRDLILPIITDQKKYSGAAFLPWFEEAGVKLEGAKPPKKSKAPYLPPLDNVKKLLTRLKNEHAEQVWPDIQVIMKEFEHYAHATGDADFFVRSGCNFATKLLRSKPEYALELAREANRWQPSHEHAWTLWAEALAALGKNDLAEAVYWETLRRFPEDEVSRGDFAKFLAGTGRLPEAERLYQETAKRFPGNVVCRVALAHLVKERDPAGAIKLFKEALELDKDDVQGFNTLAELLAKTGAHAEAENLYRKTMDRFQYNLVCRCALAFWLLRWDRLEEAEKLYKDIVSRFSGDSFIQSLCNAIQKKKKGMVVEMPNFLEKETRERNAQLPATARKEGAVEMDNIEPGDEDVYAPFRENLIANRADFQLRTMVGEEERGRAFADLDGLLKSNPDHVLGHLARALHDNDYRKNLTENLEAKFPHAYPLRFLEAHGKGDAEKWKLLQSEFRSHEYLTLLGKIASRTDAETDADAALKLFHWTQNGNGSNGDGFGKYVKKRLKTGLFKGGNEEPEPARIFHNLSEHRDEIGFLIHAGLKKAVYEDVLP
ncbi:MAG: tetratricopeptide repeat protein [Nitrospinae bacterium]|nr:tetratricopeptide repeat protein [Nitrospinota bacterium]